MKAIKLDRVLVYLVLILRYFKGYSKWGEQHTLKLSFPVQSVHLEHETRPYLMILDCNSQISVQSKCKYAMLVYLELLYRWTRINDRAYERSGLEKPEKNPDL